MYGSGKTCFGSHFLKRLDELKDTAAYRKLFEGAEAQAAKRCFQTALYVYVNIAFCIRDNMHPENGPDERPLYLQLAVFRNILSSLCEDDRTKVVNAIGRTPLQRATVDEVVENVSKVLGRTIFLHLDDIQRWSSLNSSSQEIEAEFRALWAATLAPLILKKQFVYCSGRSAELYVVGRSEGNRGSPGQATYSVVLPGLAQCHVVTILQHLLGCGLLSKIKALPETTVESSSLFGAFGAPVSNIIPTLTQDVQLDRLADFIIRATAGVPRFVWFACRLLVKSDPNMQLCENYDGFLQSLLEVAKDKGGPAQLSPFYEVNPYHPTLQRFRVVPIVFKLAAFQIPIDIDQQTQVLAPSQPAPVAVSAMQTVTVAASSDVAMPPAAPLKRESKCGINLQLCAHFGLFLATIKNTDSNDKDPIPPPTKSPRTDLDEKQDGTATHRVVTVVIPDLVLSYVSQCEMNLVPGLQFYRPLLADPTMREIIAAPNGTALEAFVRGAVMARCCPDILALLPHHAYPTMSQLFPPLVHSQIASMTISAALTVLPFPKVLDDPVPVTPASTEPQQEAWARFEAEQKKTPQQLAEAKQIFRSSVKHFPFKENVLYVPREKSSSPDCWITGKLNGQLCALSFSIKDSLKLQASQHVSESMVEKEIAKSFDFPFQTQTLLFIHHCQVVALLSRRGQQNEMGWVFNSNSARPLQGLQNGREVVVLNDKGNMSMLGERLWDVLCHRSKPDPFHDFSPEILFGQPDR